MSEKFSEKLNLRPGEQKGRVDDVDKAVYMAEAGDQNRTDALSARIAKKVLKDLYVSGRTGRMNMNSDNNRLRGVHAKEMDIVNSRLQAALERGDITAEVHEKRYDTANNDFYQFSHPESFSAMAVKLEADSNGGITANKETIEGLAKKSQRLDEDADKRESAVAQRYDEVKDL